MSGKGAEVVMLPGADRALDAAKFVHEASAEGARGIVVIAFYEGRMDPRFFGTTTNRDLAWAGAAITARAMED